MLFSAEKLTAERDEVAKQIADIEAFMVKPVQRGFPTAFKDMHPNRRKRTFEGLEFLKAKVAAFDAEIAKHAENEHAELKAIAEHEAETLVQLAELAAVKIAEGKV